MEAYNLHSQPAKVPLAAIPVFSPETFFENVTAYLSDPAVHCFQYYAYRSDHFLKYICILGNDANGEIYLLSQEHPDIPGFSIPSLTAEVPAMHIFEREIHENFGVYFEDHPWLKPVRIPFDRFNPSAGLYDYPFYKIQTDELHEVGVGPIHAGVIEPGHFRFQCHGEQVLHLEIQLGWQHRGIEALYLAKPSLLQRILLSESIAGDTVTGHTLAFVSGIEALQGFFPSPDLCRERMIALEWERIAMHIFDLSNLSTGAAYQLGNASLGVLRTLVINFFQSWCGNRFAKGLSRAGGSYFPLHSALREQLQKTMNEVESRFKVIEENTFYLPSVQLRFRNIGTLSREQATLVGAVGNAAKMTGLPRDTRASHPYLEYRSLNHQVKTDSNGDIMARIQVRIQEVYQSIRYIRVLLSRMEEDGSLLKPFTDSQLRLAPSHLSFSVTEGWRGEIVHTSITDESGKIMHYKIKDPSVHNWKMLELSLRNLEISDFPINNKSYNLSYCGHDL